MLLARCFNSVNIRKYNYIQNTIIAYISNLLQTCYTVLVNILVLVIIQSPFHLSVNTTHTTHLHTFRHRGSKPPTHRTRQGSFPNFFYLLIYNVQTAL